MLKMTKFAIKVGKNDIFQHFSFLIFFKTMKDIRKLFLQEWTGCTGVPLTAPIFRRCIEFFWLSAFFFTVKKKTINCTVLIHFLYAEGLWEIFNRRGRLCSWHEIIWQLQISLHRLVHRLGIILRTHMQIKSEQVYHNFAQLIRGK